MKSQDFLLGQKQNPAIYRQWCTSKTDTKCDIKRESTGKNKFNEC